MCVVRKIALQDELAVEIPIAPDARELTMFHSPAASDLAVLIGGELSMPGAGPATNRPDPDTMVFVSTRVNDEERIQKAAVTTNKAARDSRS